jgi:hypothetical protein
MKLKRLNLSDETLDYPVVVLESAAIMTPPLNSAAKIVVFVI